MQNNRASKFRKLLLSNTKKVVETELAKFPDLHKHHFQKPLIIEIDPKQSEITWYKPESLTEKQSAQLMLDTNTSYNDFLYAKRVLPNHAVKDPRVSRRMAKDAFRQKVSVTLNKNNAYTGMLIRNTDNELQQWIDNKKNLFEIMRMTMDLQRCVDTDEIKIIMDHANRVIHVHTLIILSIDGIRVYENNKELFFLRWGITEHPHELSRYILLLAQNLEENYLNLKHSISQIDVELKKLNNRTWNVHSVITGTELVKAGLTKLGFLGEFQVTVKVISRVALGADLVCHQILYNMTIQKQMKDETEVIPWIPFKHKDRLDKDILLNNIRNYAKIIPIKDFLKIYRWRINQVLHLLSWIPAHLRFPCALHLIIREACSDVKILQYILIEEAKKTPNANEFEYKNTLCKVLIQIGAAKSTWRYYLGEEYVPSTEKQCDHLYSLFRQKLPQFHDLPILQSIQLFMNIKTDLSCVVPAHHRPLNNILNDIHQRAEIRCQYLKAMQHNAYYELVLTNVIPLFFQRYYIPALFSQQGHENKGKFYKSRVKRHSPNGGGNFSARHKYHIAGTSDKYFAESISTMNDYVVVFDMVHKTPEEEKNKLKRKKGYWDAKTKQDRQLFTQKDPESLKRKRLEVNRQMIARTTEIDNFKSNKRPRSNSQEIEDQHSLKKICSYTKLTRKGSSYRVIRAQKCVQRLDMNLHEFIVIIVHISNNHWVPVIVTIKSKIISVQDSMNIYNREIYGNIRQFMQDYTKYEFGVSCLNNWSLDTADTYYQKGGCECGPLTLARIQDKLQPKHRRQHLKEKDMPMFRNFIFDQTVDYMQAPENNITCTLSRFFSYSLPSTVLSVLYWCLDFRKSIQENNSEAPLLSALKDLFTKMETDSWVHVSEVIVAACRDASEPNLCMNNLLYSIFDDESSFAENAKLFSYAVSERTCYILNLQRKASLYQALDESCSRQTIKSPPLYLVLNIIRTDDAPILYENYLNITHYTSTLRKGEIHLYQLLSVIYNDTGYFKAAVKLESKWFSISGTDVDEVSVRSHITFTKNATMFIYKKVICPCVGSCLSLNDMKNNSKYLTCSE